MSSRPLPSRDTATGPSNVRDAQPRTEKPLPPLPSSSLPNSYEIPALRQRQSPESAGGTPARHGRSVSHPFPSFFGSSKKPDRRREEDDLDSSDGGTPTKADIARSKSGPTNKTSSTTKADRQPQTGKCMTCDSTVRWPQEVKVFRCTTCLTINDLEPYDEQRSGHDSGRPVTARKPMAISLDRTRKMIDHCMNGYFEQLLREDFGEGLDRSSSAALDDPTLAATELPRPGPGNRTQSDSTSNSSPFRTDPSTMHHSNSARFGPQQASGPQHEGTTTNGNTSQATSGFEGLKVERPAAVFRLLENYVTGCFTSCTALNMSFFSIQPATPLYDRKEVEPGLIRQNSDPVAAPSSGVETGMFELDAKTLLLGDVVENGSWWTGDRTIRQKPVDQTREKSPERWRGIVSAKTPRINWSELAGWYQLLIRAGHDWQRRWTIFQSNLSEALRGKWHSIPPSRIQQDINESQTHLQRSLLKATENLLKRPRRPLTNPEDCRFLLMLLANPLLSASSPQGSVSNAPQPSTLIPTSQQPSSLRSLPMQQAISASKRTGALGHHSGIIKRILGLVANLPNDTHQFLVSWMSRFSDNHFQKLIDIVGGFLTYRLSKDQDRVVRDAINPTAGLIPSFSDSGIRHASELHAQLELRPSNSSKTKDHGKPKLGIYSTDWQVRAAARVMALLFQANTGHTTRKRDLSITRDQSLQNAGLNAKYQANCHGQIVPISTFYNTLLDHADLIADFEAWEVTKTKFTFCQYPFFLSIWAKIRILEHDARRQMEVRAREAFFDSILSRKAVSQYLFFKVRRNCLVEDSLKNVSEVIGSGSNDIKKGLRIDFVGEEGIDAGGLRKEWFLLLVREIFDPHYGLFVYDDDSRYCYFNPYCFESSEQFFLVGVLLGLAIYNSTILDVAFPPFVFKKLLASAPLPTDKLVSVPKVAASYTLEDLAELRPALAKGLRQLLEFDGDVQETFCRDFVVEIDKYGEIVQAPLCANGHKRAVTNSNRREFVDLYVRYMLDTAVVRQYEPFKRGFFTVCGGNALSLFRPEEIELLVRGSDEPLDVSSLRAVASYENWPKNGGPPEKQAQVVWFWECFERATPSDQRKLLVFITGSDRIPAMGATNLNIKLQLLRDVEAENHGRDIARFPIARTCFNALGLYRYQSKNTLETKLWTAVHGSEGFGLK